MSIQIKAKETIQTVGPFKGEYAFRLRTEKYNTLDLDKALELTNKRCGIDESVIEAALKAYAKVMMTWLIEGHSIIIPGFGTMRYAIKASVAKNVEDVNMSLINLRKIIFTPFPKLKKELDDTDIIITCYDRNGKVVKTVGSDVAEEADS